MNGASSSVLHNKQSLERKLTTDLYFRLFAVSGFNGRVPEHILALLFPLLRARRRLGFVRYSAAPRRSQWSVRVRGTPVITAADVGGAREPLGVVTRFV